VLLFFAPPCERKPAFYADKEYEMEKSTFISIKRANEGTLELFILKGAIDNTGGISWQQEILAMAQSQASLPASSSA
jgi:hypothetical protein